MKTVNPSKEGGVAYGYIRIAYTILYIDSINYRSRLRDKSH